MNAKAKGSRAEHKSKKYLEAQGYTVTRSAASLGVFDLVGFCKSNTVLVQVKAGSARVSPAELQQMQAFQAAPFTLKLIHYWRDYAREPEVEQVNSHLAQE